MADRSAAIRADREKRWKAVMSMLKGKFTMRFAAGWSTPSCPWPQEPRRNQAAAAQATVAEDAADREAGDARVSWQAQGLRRFERMARGCVLTAIWGGAPFRPRSALSTTRKRQARERHDEGEQRGAPKPNKGEAEV